MHFVEAKLISKHLSYFYFLQPFFFSFSPLLWSFLFLRIFSLKFTIFAEPLLIKFFFYDDYLANMKDFLTDLVINFYYFFKESQEKELDILWWLFLLILSFLNSLVIWIWRWLSDLCPFLSMIYFWNITYVWINWVEFGRVKYLIK